VSSYFDKKTCLVDSGASQNYPSSLSDEEVDLGKNKSGTGSRGSCLLRLAILRASFDANESKNG
jgi:hypothetical protein